jgi:hypothetical protein
MARIEQADKMPPKASNGAGEANTIDQVRELLFGGTRRSIEQQLADAETKIDARITELRAELLDRIATLEARLIDAQRHEESERGTAIRNIGTAIADLGATIGNLGASRTGR